jgi:DNA-binding NarL/FixJ family response regulator
VGQKAPIRVLIAEDHSLFAEGLQLMLEKAKDIEVIAAATDGLEAVELAERLSPEVVVMDLGLPRLDGWGAIQRIQELHRRTKVVILTMYADELLVQRARELGVQGYLLKDSNRLELITAIRAAVLGKRFFGSITAAPMDPVRTYGPIDPF